MFMHMGQASKGRNVIDVWHDSEPTLVRSLELVGKAVVDGCVASVDALCCVLNCIQSERRRKSRFEE